MARRVALSARCLHNLAMTFELLFALAAFALVSSITPGPNNLMLMASGANYGFRRTLPHMLGVTLGFMLMVLLVGVGLVQVFDAFPVSYQLLKVVSVGYLLYLAWKIATAAPVNNGSDSEGAPFTFVQAALFQWVNPKAWTMALTATLRFAVGWYPMGGWTRWMKVRRPARRRRGLTSRPSGWRRTSNVQQRQIGVQYGSHSTQRLLRRLSLPATPC